MPIEKPGESDNRTDWLEILSDTAPGKILAAAIREAPFMRYALAVAGLASVVAIALSFGLSPRVALLGSLVVLALMVVLVVFAKLVDLSGVDVHTPAIVLMWSFLSLLILWSALLTSSVFAGWPLPLKAFLVGGVSQNNEIRPPATSSSVEENQRIQADITSLGRLKQTVKSYSESAHDGVGGILQAVSSGGPDAYAQFSCNAGPCPDGTMTQAMTRLLRPPPVAVQSPSHLADFQVPGLQELILLSLWVFDRWQKSLELQREGLIQRNNQTLRDGLDEARFACGLDSSKTEDLIANISRLRGLEDSSFFWGGQNTGSGTVSYSVFNPTNLENFTSSLIEIKKAHGLVPVDDGQIVEFAGLVLSDYRKAYADLSEDETLCSQRALHHTGP
jgi:hypothetical protein